MQLAFNTTDSFMVSANVCDYTRQLSLRIQGRKAKLMPPKPFLNVEKSPAYSFLPVLLISDL